MNTTPKIIGLCGPKQVGKSTLQDLLMQTDTRFVSLNFADPLKEMLCAFLDSQGVTDKLSYEMLWGSLREEASEYFEKRTPRWAMQTLGTEWGRKLIGDNLWINTWKRQVARYAPPIVIIAADMRFLNEARAVKELGGIVVRIERDGRNPSQHISEREYLKVRPDLIITNNSDAIDMLYQLEPVIREP